MDLSDVSILKLMPPNIARDPGVKMMSETFDAVLREIIGKIQGVAIIPNLVLSRIVNETLLDCLAWQFHVDFYEPDLPMETKQALVLNSPAWHAQKGTPGVVEDIVSTVFSKAKIEEWYEYGGLPYRFRVSTEDEILDTKTLEKLMRAIKSVKNTRSFLDTLNQIVDFDVNVYFATGAELKLKEYIIADEVPPFDTVIDYGAVAPMVLTRKYIIVDDAPMPDSVADSGATATHQTIQEVYESE